MQLPLDLMYAETPAAGADIAIDLWQQSPLAL